MDMLLYRLLLPFERRHIFRPVSAFLLTFYQLSQHLCRLTLCCSALSFYNQESLAVASLLKIAES